MSFKVALIMLLKAGGCAGPAKNRKDNYNAGRFIAKTFYLPAGRQGGTFDRLTDHLSYVSQRPL
jgi:hypothetical protein